MTAGKIDGWRGGSGLHFVQPALVVFSGFDGAFLQH